MSGVAGTPVMDEPHANSDGGCPSTEKPASTALRSRFAMAWRTISSMRALAASSDTQVPPAATCPAGHVALAMAGPPCATASAPPANPSHTAPTNRRRCSTALLMSFAPSRATVARHRRAVSIQAEASPCLPLLLASRADAIFARRARRFETGHVSATKCAASGRNGRTEGGNPMRIPTMFKAAFIALIVLAGAGLQEARADTGSIVLTIFKGGWIIGGSAGHGTLTFRGKSYPLSVGGLDYGLVFGGSKTVLRGQVKQHQQAVRRCRRLCRGGRWACGRQGRARDRAHQSEGRRARAFRQAGRPDGQCRSERPCDHDEVAAHAGHRLR